MADESNRKDRASSEVIAKQNQEKVSEKEIETNLTSELRSASRKESCVGDKLRKSLQSCKLSNNEAKLEALLKKTASKSLTNILHGLLYILRQLLVQSMLCEKAIGFLSFEDAYGFYCGFVNSHPDEANFRDHLLHREHGLCVVICELHGQRYVLLQNEQVSVHDLLLELEKVNEENKTLASMKNRYPLNAKSLHSILNSMDTEYDRMAMKAVVFALHSRPEIYNLGIKPERQGCSFSLKSIVYCR